MKVLLLALALLAAPAAAQTLASSALRGHDNRAPIDVDSDRIEVLDQQNRAIFSGGVRVRQGTLSLDAARVTVVYERGAGAEPVIRRLDAEGQVRLASPSERATARFAIYDVEGRILTLIGGVELTRGAERLQGNRLTINLDTGRSTLDGRTSDGSGGGRVTGRFAVPERR
ncbi:MAG: LptA/OstA family protein [Sphingomonadaceae bacterium]